MKPQYKKFLEGHANTLRARCDVPPFGRLDPFALAQRMEIRVQMLDENSGVSADDCARLLGYDSRVWSAGTLHLPDGSSLVVMNPTHDRQRQRATLMEEIAHLHLGHRPAQLICIQGVGLRTWNHSAEQQAYWVGAAALLPERIVKGARTRGMTIEALAAEQDVSVALVKFRAKLLEIQLPSEADIRTGRQSPVDSFMDSSKLLE